MSATGRLGASGEPLRKVVEGMRTVLSQLALRASLTLGNAKLRSSS